VQVSLDVVARTLPPALQQRLGVQQHDGVRVLQLQTEVKIMESNTALALVRVSTGSQDESTQVTTLKDYAGDHGIKIVKTTTLHGYSASKGEQQPAIRAAIEGIEQNRWHLILVTDSSRLDRDEDLDAQAEILLAIRQAGGDVISTSEPQFGKTDFAGRIVTLVAQHANAEKSIKVKNDTWRGVQAIMASKASYGPLPVFWKAVGERFAKVATCTSPDDVKSVYEAVRNGQSLSSIARKYDTYPQSIRKLIRLAANYTGTFECRYTYSGQTYTWQHAAAGNAPVDLELWSAANRVMGERGAILNRTGGRPVQQATSWISGILDCPQCGGHLYVLRGKTLRCSGKGKNRRSCGVAGIDLGYVTDQIDELIYGGENPVYRFQRVSGNQGELDKLKAELQRVRDTLATTDDDEEFDTLSARRRTLREAIAEFNLVAETHDMTPTGETLADLWHLADSMSRREIMKALHSHLDFSVDAEGYFSAGELLLPGGTLVELTADTCVKMMLPPRNAPDPWIA
jgi:DNA invertase Pin-like site-specific DNA recombinase